jgi:rhamnulokinase
MNRYIAIDLGAESGRVMVGTIDGASIVLDEVHRFHNGAVDVLGHLHWDVLHLWREIKVGMGAAARRFGPSFAGIAVDTWGIDYALLDGSGALVGNPSCYRDSRTAGVMERLLEQLPRRQVYEQSGGIQFMGLNTLYQLRSMVEEESPLLAAASTFLMIPDLFAYWLSGRKAVEYTNATATQFYDALRGEWSTPLLEAAGIPAEILPEVIPAGTVLGRLLPSVAEETGVNGATPVIAVASHDTASAVVAVPAAEEDFLWLSSGTWSLLGGVSREPLVSADALTANLSSYGGAGGVVLPWRNIMGLWLLQECRRVWERQGHSFAWEELIAMAGAAPPFAAIINPDDPDFLAPADMPAAIQAYCLRTGQAAPADPGTLARVTLEALALRYRWVASWVEHLLQKRYDTLHIVGGGSQNALLNQLAADALGKRVSAGPAEATALGNVALQAVAAGHAPSLSAMRQAIRSAAAVTTCEPNTATAQAWDEAYARFLALTGDPVP